MQCKEFCKRMMAILMEDVNTVIMVSNEAHFYLYGYANKQNYWYWVVENL